MFDQLIDGVRKASESSLQMQQEMFKNFTRLFSGQAGEAGPEGNGAGAGPGGHGADEQEAAGPGSHRARGNGAGGRADGQGRESGHRHEGGQASTAAHGVGQDPP